MTINSSEQMSCVTTSRWVTPELPKIYDNQGRAYQLSFWENLKSFYIHPLDGQIRVAELQWQETGNRIFISNINVFDKARYPINWFGCLKVKLGYNASGKVVNYQRQGLGTALLRFFTEKARTQGFRSITGELWAGDLKKNPSLPDWYKRMGFAVRLGENRLSGSIERLL